jgi:hypothetical protein
MLTGDTVSGKLSPHTVTTTNNTLPMKIKSLAIAAATLAVGAISSQAQAPVYSQNVVGYVNQICVSNKYYLLCNPLTTGNDVITNVIQNPPGNTVALIWNGAGYTTYTYLAKKSAWTDSIGHTNNTIPLPPGVGFFLLPGNNMTNTYSGQVAANTGGGTATNVLGALLTPVGSIIPYGDVVTNKASMNLNVPGNTVMQYWNVGSQNFTTVTYLAKKNNWIDGSGNTNNPNIPVGQAFFLTGANTNWVQTLQ